MFISRKNEKHARMLIHFGTVNDLMYLEPEKSSLSGHLGRTLIMKPSINLLLPIPCCHEHSRDYYSSQHLAFGWNLRNITSLEQRGTHTLLPLKVVIEEFDYEKKKN